MAGYDFEFYETGTISVTAGQKAFTGTGTAWKLRGCEGALVVVAGAGAVNFVSSLSTDAAGEFRTAWAGPTLADASYVMWLPSAVAATALANHQRLAEIIAGIQGAQPESTILSAFAALQGSDGKLPMFTGENTLELVEYIADAKGSLKKLAALELAANKAITTDDSGNAQQIDLGTLGRALLPLANGTSAQYVQGDGTLQAKTALPVSSATQAALSGKLNLAGGGTIVGALGVQDARITNYANFTNVHQYSPGVYTSLGSGIWFALVVEHNPGNYYQGILQLGYPNSNKNWLFSNTGSFTAVGSINGSAKNFLIDHPVDPDNYDLRHCSTEAPEMLVEYRGTARLVNGRITVDIEQYYGVQPGTFDALWTDAWVTALQNQDGFDRLKPSRVNGATFEIICENETSSDLVSWVLMARRNDPYVRWEGCDFTDGDGKLIIEPAKEIV